MSEDIIEKITKLAPTIKETDIDEWALSSLIENYSSKIVSLSKVAYNLEQSDSNLVAHHAFKELAADTLKKGLKTYLFVSEHWKTGRDLNSYLLSCLNRLADKVKSDTNGAKRINVPVCPACKFYGQKEYLYYEGKLLRCAYCTSTVNRLETEVENNKTVELFFRRIFCLHTRRGWRCPDCDKFVPDSFVQQQGNDRLISCPYPNCLFFGDKYDLELMSHPSGLGALNNISLNADIVNYKKTKYNRATNLQDYLQDEILNIDDKMELCEKFNNELLALKEVIDLQSGRINKNSTSIKKYLMYQAYKNMIDKYPEDMVSYLVHLKHGTGSPIQARIFQEYVRLIQNNLPFSIFKAGKEKEIYSLLDPDLGLFWGISEFNAVVQDDKTIINNTIETYVGGRKLKDFGPCFIGLLIDVLDESDNSLINCVVDYTFMQINLNDNVIPGTKVKVKHFRIPSHYEMGNLVNLQRSRRRIVDSVYFKLNGKKRIVKGQNAKEY